MIPLFLYKRLLCIKEPVADQGRCFHRRNLRLSYKIGGQTLNPNNIELLAPAGSYEGFEAAIGAGADAVYVGGAMFGARAYARNFNEEELLHAIDAAHIHGRKLYLTVNTLLKNRELKEQLVPYLEPYYNAGLDAVIVQDMGVFSLIKKEFPKLHLHASTQMTVTGPEGMKFLADQGATRVVAARELSLEELSRMHKACPIEIEAFVHGALCYSYSGQCLMSSLLGGRSGNRGRCAQPCRLPYQVKHFRTRDYQKGEFCPLSLKDICTIEILPEIIDAGVTSLKIEGRMKQPVYTAGVTGMYRKYLDLLFERGPENYHVTGKDKKYLLDLFNRGGSCTGYYQMGNGPKMMAFTNEKKTGEVSLKPKQLKIKIKGELSLTSGLPALLHVSCKDAEAMAYTGEVQLAKNQPVTRERVLQQMDKLGNTVFTWESLDIQMNDAVFVPMKVLNEIRHQALEELTKNLLKKYRRNVGLERIERIAHGPQPKIGDIVICDNVPLGKEDFIPVYASCESEEAAEILCQQKEIQGIYLPYVLMEDYLQKGLANGKEMYLSLPHITRGNPPEGYLEQAKKWLEAGMTGFLVRNLESYSVLAQMGLADRCVLDHSLYTWNDEAIHFWKDQKVLRNTVPLELNEKELRHRENTGSEMVVYGRLPLMHSAQCVRKNTSGCNHQEDRLVLRDRYDKEFPIVCYCRPWKTGNTKETGPCYNIIYNSLPYGLLKEAGKVKELGFSSVRLSFTIESGKETKRIVEDFAAAYHEGRVSGEGEFTKGHFKRGAE